LHTFRALRYRNFRLFFIGQGLSVIGTWLQQVAMGWLTYRISGSVLLLGVVAFCGSAGILVFGTFAGVVADHVRCRPALRITQTLALFQAVVLALLTWSGHIAVWHLIVLALFLGLVQAFDANHCGSISSKSVPTCRMQSPSTRSLSTGRESSDRRSPGCCFRSSAKPCASR